MRSGARHRRSRPGSSSPKNVLMTRVSSGKRFREGEDGYGVASSFSLEMDGCRGSKSHRRWVGDCQLRIVPFLPNFYFYFLTF